MENNETHSLVKETCIESFYDIKNIQGYFMGGDESIMPSSSNPDMSIESLFTTELLTKKAFAMAKLSQIIKTLNGDWVADWNNDKQMKHFLFRKNNDVFDAGGYVGYSFISFKDWDTKEYFLSIPEFVQLAKDYFEIKD